MVNLKHLSKITTKHIERALAIESEFGKHLKSFGIIATRHHNHQTCAVTKHKREIQMLCLLKHYKAPSQKLSILKELLCREKSTWPICLVPHHNTNKQSLLCRVKAFFASF